jgi:hypothetical protein
MQGPPLRPGERVEASLARDQSGVRDLRWPRPVGQFGGLAKLGSGCR